MSLSSALAGRTTEVSESRTMLVLLGIPIIVGTVAGWKIVDWMQKKMKKPDVPDIAKLAGTLTFGTIPGFFIGGTLLTWIEKDEA